MGIVTTGPPVGGSVPAAAGERKAAGLAFVLGLLLPGLGHLYCRKFKTGLITFACFAGVLAVVRYVGADAHPLVWGYALRAAIVLSIFSFLDAFCTAGEMNSGIDSLMAGKNPRIAAALNLLTNGFGYFYLGERKKGLVCFAALRILARIQLGLAEPASSVLAVGLEIALLLIATDAYRIARRMLRQAAPGESSATYKFAPHSGFPAGIPVVLGCLFALGYFGLVAAGLMLPDYSKIDQAPSSINESGDGKVYLNPAYGVEVRTPAGWGFDREDKSYFFEAVKLNGACRVGLMPSASLPVRSTKAEARAIVAEVIKRNPAFRLVSENTTELNGMPAYEVALTTKVKDVDLTQRYVLVRKRLSMHTLVETTADIVAPLCEADVRQIRSSVKF